MLVALRVFRAPEGPAAREARRPHFVRRRASKPARALRSLRRPPHQWFLAADVWLGALSRRPARPCCRPWASQGSCALRFLAVLLRVVTNVVNRRCFSRGFLIRCYKRRKSDGFFAENSGFWEQIDDVCNRSPRKGWSSPVEWCNRFVSFGLGYALSWSGVSSCWVGCGVSRDLVRMSRLR